MGKDKYSFNIIVDLDRRADDKTNASILILGNSGQGKSFLLNAERSRYTAQWSRGSRFRCMAVTSAATSWRLASAVTLCADRLLLRQREGFLSANPAGADAFGSLFERVLPASSVANLFPFNYSGKTDPHGFYVGKDKYSFNIIVDLDRLGAEKVLEERDVLTEP